MFCGIKFYSFEILYTQSSTSFGHERQQEQRYDLKSIGGKFETTNNNIFSVILLLYRFGRSMGYLNSQGFTESMGDLSQDDFQ